jgi:hypothetical protein
MPLHRDIHWIGRQWAVTGHGMQLIDQKQKGSFDIEVSRLWEEALIEGLRAQQWLNVADFDRGLEVARKRYTDQPRAEPRPPDEIVLPAPLPVARPVPAVTPVASAPPIVPTAPVIVSIKPLAETPAPAQIAKPAEPPPQKPEMNEPAKPALGKFNMRFLGYAKFIRPWRVRMKD